MNDKFEYIEIKQFQNFPVIEILDINGFNKLAVTNGIKFIFIKKQNEDSSNNIFFFPVNSIIYSINGGLYHSAEDYLDAVKNGFPDAATYYEAIKSGCTTFVEYEHMKKIGLENKELYNTAQKLGYIKGFEEFLIKYDSYKKNPGTAAIPGDIDNAVKLMIYADGKGFRNYKEFEKIYDHGFPDILLYNEAVSKGFKTSEDFYNGIKAGFPNAKEYEESKRLSINSKKEYDNFKYFKTNCPKTFSFDKYQALEILEHSENGSKVKLNELFNKLSEEQEKYKRGFDNIDIKVLPLWYSSEISDEEVLDIFLQNEEMIKKQGFYNKETKVFEIFRISKTKIIIDASNVARFSMGETHTARLKFIKIMADDLKSKGFTEIIAIADASLKHIVTDGKILEQLKKEINFCETPSHTSADEFIIENARNEKCLIVSNDNFNDWKIKDKWIANNIDSVRIPFIFTDNKVTMPGLNKMINDGMH